LSAPVLAQQPVFRSAVELIAVDVQVIDRTGNPVGSLEPGAFTVSINGKRRKVVSAQFIRHTDTTASAAPGAPLFKTAGDSRPDAASRTVVIAIDSGSFEPGATRVPMDAAQGFVRQLGADDLVGLFTYPTQTWILPTTQRAPVQARLKNLVGERQALRSYYNLSPHEIVDITTEATNPFAFFMGGGLDDPDLAVEMDPVLKVAKRECPNGDRDCPSLIYGEGMSLSTQLEREAERSLQGLDTLLRLVSGIPGRKAVVLVTGGLLVSDKAEGHPDVGDIARLMGQTAARANATVYTVHVDQTFFSGYGNPAKRGAGTSDLARDRAMAGNWLEDFSRSAGGTRINVPPGGDADFAFNRVLRETSGYYLLGVEPADADRDGKPRELRVKVHQQDTTVRSRQWVVIPPKRRT
jgi:VWFA-related protein